MIEKLNKCIYQVKALVEENVFACHHISINIAGSDWAVWYFCFQYKKIHVSMLNEDEELL